jgi:hypothetical protein
MDEVDFTILAATSVLTDLIEKCPPAEACRDAFNRMSKATVQMCMSTTGFNSSAQSLNSRSQRHHRPAAAEDMANDYFGAPSSGQFALSNSRNQRLQPPSRPQRTSSGQHQEQTAGRQKPQFDMGLNDLYPSTNPIPLSNPIPELQNQQAYGLPSSNSARNVKNEYSPINTYSTSQNQIKSPKDYDTSPPQAQRSFSGDTSAIDPSLLPSPQAQTQLQTQTPQQPQAFLPQNPQLAYDDNNNNYNDLSFPIQDMGQDPDLNMDLDFLNGPGMNDVPGMDNFQNITMDGQPGGLDLGFGLGLGWEGVDHDFSEGGQLDLFDGELFFFSFSRSLFLDGIFLRQENDGV